MLQGRKGQGCKVLTLKTLSLVGNRNRLKTETPKPKQSVFEKQILAETELLDRNSYFCRNAIISAEMTMFLPKQLFQQQCTSKNEFA